MIAQTFEPLVDKSYGGVLNTFDRGGAPFNQKHIDAANKFEDERNRIIAGMERIDACTDLAHFKRIRTKIQENVEGPLCDALCDLFHEFLEAVYKGIKDDLK